MGHRDRVVVWADTALEVLPLFAGAAKLGAVFAPLNARLGVEEATAVARLARPRLLVTDAAHTRRRTPRWRERRASRRTRRSR